MGARTFAIGGALAFFVSLLVFAVQYTAGFDRLPVRGDSWALPAFINFTLFTSFAVHHSVFARPGLKSFVTSIVSPSLERATYVWIASILFLAVCLLWQGVPGRIWSVSGVASMALRAVQIGGVVFTVVAARHLDVFELAGVRQAFDWKSSRATGLDEHGPYGFVRHPIYFAWLLLVWATPVMTGTHVVFAATSTFYLVIAIPFEERDLRRSFGAAYDRYAARVRWRMLPGLY